MSNSLSCCSLTNRRRVSVCPNTLRTTSCSEFLKEVIQPHVPVRLPCYDFTPITGRNFIRHRRTSITTDFHGVTGGVYKTREHIHRGMADPRLLAIPASWRRVAASNPNLGYFLGIGSTSRYCKPIMVTIVARVSPWI